MEANSPTLGFLLHDVARLLRRRFEQNARGSGLTRSQWQVLAYLAQNEGINQTGLADLLEIEAVTLGRIVDKLETQTTGRTAAASHRPQGMDSSSNARRASGGWHRCADSGT